MTNDSLQTTLINLLQSETESNIALNSLLGDYTTYHVVLLIIGGCFTLIFVVLSILFWVRFKRAPKTEIRKWTFEQKTYFSFGLLTTIVGLVMMLIVVANAGTVLNPRPGLLEVINEFGTSQGGAHRAELYQSFNTWLQSGSRDVPALIQSKINDRLAWQRPKAIICSVLLAIFVATSVRIWSALIKKSKVRETKLKLNEKALLVSGCFSVASCLLLMLMVLGNTQATFAPMSLTLFLG
jgi:cytochrome bd-type quinol oxidase subunit 2